jgi:hypothetical protein
MLLLHNLSELRKISLFNLKLRCFNSKVFTGIEEYLTSYILKINMTSRNLFTTFYRFKNGYKYKCKSLNNITFYSFSSQSHDRKL